MSDQHSQNLIKLIKKRHSVRAFSPQRVDRELLLQCVEAARLAPSAENVQPWRFIIIDDEQQKKRLVQKAFSGIYRASRWAEKAPVLVVLGAEPDILANRVGKQITGIHYYLIDCGIAGEHFVLQATELGLDTCWIGWFSQRGVKKALNLPASWRIASLFAVGYGKHQSHKHKKRHPLDKLCSFNSLTNDTKS